MEGPQTYQSNIASEVGGPGSDKRNISGSLFVFVVLFLFALGMLIYYQFYQGYGIWRFTLLHKSNDTTLLLAIMQHTHDTGSNLKIITNATQKDTEGVKADTIQKNNASIKTNTPDSTPTGTVYEVQIGTFENYELKKYNAVFNNLHEEKIGILTRLTLGRFKDEKQANNFRKDIAKLGIKDAWVVKKVDGKRMR